MHIDWTITIDGMITGGVILLGGVTTFVLMRRDVSDVKDYIREIRDQLEIIPTTLARHDERIKSLEIRQQERLYRERSHH